MSKMEPRGLFRLLRQPVYRRELARVRRGGEEPLFIPEQSRKLVLISSSETGEASRELKFACANLFETDFAAVTCVTPAPAWNSLDQTPDTWRGIVYGQKQATRFALPNRSLVDKVRVTTASIVVAMNFEPDWFSQILFAACRCHQKVAFHGTFGPGHATLLVTPAVQASEMERLHLLFHSMAVFLPGPERSPIET